METINQPPHQEFLNIFSKANNPETRVEAIREFVNWTILQRSRNNLPKNTEKFKSQTAYDFVRVITKNNPDSFTPTFNSAVSAGLIKPEHFTKTSRQVPKRTISQI